MIAWRDLKIVGPDGAELRDDAVRAAALALAYEAGTVRVLAPSGDEIEPADIAWHGIEAVGAEPIHGRDDNNLWQRASVYTREMIQDPRFPTGPEPDSNANEEIEEVRA